MKHTRKNKNQKGGKYTQNKNTRYRIKASRSLSSDSLLKHTKGKPVKTSRRPNPSYKRKPHVKMIKANMIYKIERISDYAEPLPPSNELDIYHFEYPKMGEIPTYNPRKYVKEPTKQPEPRSVFFCEIPDTSDKTKRKSRQKGGNPCNPLTPMTLDQVKIQLLKNPSGLSCNLDNYGTICRTEITNGIDSVVLFSLGQGSFNAVFTNEVFSDCTQEKHILRISVASFLPEQIYSKIDELANEIYYGMVASAAGVGPNIYKFGIMMDHKDNNKVYLYSVIDRVDGCDIHSLLDKTSTVPNTNDAIQIDSGDFTTSSSPNSGLGSTNSGLGSSKNSFKTALTSSPNSFKTALSSSKSYAIENSTDTIGILKKQDYARPSEISSSTPQVNQRSMTTSSPQINRSLSNHVEPLISYCNPAHYPTDFESRVQTIIDKSIQQLTKVGTDCGLLMMDSKSPNMLTTNDGSKVYVIDYDAKFMLHENTSQPTKKMYGKINVILFLSFVYYLSVLLRSQQLYPNGTPNRLAKFVLEKLKEQYYESSEFEKIRDFMQNLYFENHMFRVVCHNYKYTELGLLKIRYFTKYFLTFNEMQKIQDAKLTFFRDKSIKYPVFVQKDETDPNQSKIVYNDNDRVFAKDVSTNDSMWLYSIHRLCLGKEMNSCITFEPHNRKLYTEYIKQAILPEYKLFLYHYFQNQVKNPNIRLQLNRILANNDSIEQKLPEIVKILTPKNASLIQMVDESMDPFRDRLLDEFKYNTDEQHDEHMHLKHMWLASIKYGVVTPSDTTFESGYEEQHAMFDILNRNPYLQDLMQKYKLETQPTSVFL